MRVWPGVYLGGSHFARNHPQVEAIGSPFEPRLASRRRGRTLVARVGPSVGETGNEVHVDPWHQYAVVPSGDGNSAPPATMLMPTVYVGATHVSVEEALVTRVESDRIICLGSNRTRDGGFIRHDVTWKGHSIS